MNHIADHTGDHESPNYGSIIMDGASDLPDGRQGARYQAQ